jgi:CubicO group peptidase (beta-lactamase class C family)
MELRNARRVFALLLLTFASVVSFAADPLPRAKPEEVGLSSERLARLSSVFQGYVDEGKLAGAVVLVARRGKLAYLQPFGTRDRESKAPMREDSIFRIASQTKALTSVGIMVLQEQGKLLISDPVGKYLPEFLETTVALPREGGGYDIVKARRPVTIHDLLTHMAGLGYGDNGPAVDKWKEAGIQGWYFADRNEPIGATIARLAKLPFEAQPGEKWIYGYSIDVLGALIERVSGQKLDEFIRATVTEPLQMSDTEFFLPKSKKDRLTVVYAREESSKVTRVPDGMKAESQGAYLDGPRKSFSGGAGLLSTAGDYARFLQMLLNGGELDGKRILSRKSVELMTADAIPDKQFRDGQGFGLGFAVVRDVGVFGQPSSIGEFGWGGAYHSTYWVDPKEQLVVVYLTQLRPAPDDDDHRKLRTMIYQAIVD